METTLQRENLRHYGFKNAGLATGNATSFKTHLELIYNGKVLDEKTSIGLSEEDKNSLSEEMEHLQDKVNILQKQHITSQVKGDEIGRQIEVLQQERQDIILGKKALSIPGGRFSTLKFSINSFFLVMLSVYLFLFYVATVYKALFIDLGQLAEQMSDPGGLIGAGALPGPQEMWEAMRYNIVVIFAPFIFYGFGYALHVILEQKSKWKYLAVLLIVAVTFVLDFLIAYKIHLNTNQVMELMGLDNEVLHWSQSPTFFIIIFMGFIVFIIWSILLHAWIKEWGKKDITGRIDEAILNLRNEVKFFDKQKEEYQHKIAETESKIRYLNQRLNNIQIPESDLQLSVSEFVAGWFNYLSAAGDQLEPVKDACEKVLSDFKEKHYIHRNNVNGL
jgi:hypothetical protein